MTEDVVFTIGGDNDPLKKAFNDTEKQITAAVQRLQREINTRLNQVSNSFTGTAKATDQFADSQREASKEAQQTARQVNSEAIKQASTKWLALTAAVGAAVGAYLAARKAGKEVEKQQESAVGTLLKLGGAYVSFRSAIDSVATVLRTGIGFEQQRTQLQGLFQSVAQGNQAFQWVRDFPVQAAGFDQALQTLKGFGTPDLFNTLTKLNEATLTLGDSNNRLGRIALAVGQGFAANTLRAEELNQLIDAGIPVFELFQETLGKSAIEVRKLAAEGKLGREEILGLIDAIGERFQGGAERSLNSVSGLLGAIQKEFAKFLGSIADAGLLDFVKQQLRALFSEIQRLKDTGELQVIAQNISNALVAIGRGLAAVGQQVGRALLEFFKTENLENFAEVAEAALKKLGGGLAAVINYIGPITTAVKTFIALKFAASIGLAAASISGLIFALIKYRAAIFTAIVATTQFIANLITSSTVGRVLTLVLGTVRTAALASAAAFSIAFGAVGLLILGVSQLISNFTESAEAARRLQEELQADTRFLRELLEIQEDLDKAGLDKINDQIALVRQLRNEEKISSEEALKLIRERFQAATEVLTQIRDKEKEIASLRSQLERQINEEAKQARIEVLQTSIESAQKELQAKKQQLSEALREEEKYTKKAKELRQQLVDDNLSTEDKITDIRRKGQSESRQQLDIRLELFRLEGEIQKQLVAAAQAQTQAERESAIELAKNRQERARSIIDQLSGQNEAIQATRKFKNIKDQVTQAEIKLAEDSAQAERQKAEDFKKSVAESEQAIIGLKKQIDLLKEPVSVEVQVNLAKAKKDLADLQNQLKTIENTPIDIRPDVDETPIQHLRAEAIDKEIKIPVKADAEEAKEEVKELVKIPPPPPPIKYEVLTEKDKAAKDLASLQKQVDELKKGAVVPITAKASGFNRGGEVQRFKSGGRVYGPGGIDKVQALLTAGEFVITRSGDNILKAIEYYVRQSPRLADMVRAYTMTRLPSIKIPRYQIPKLKPVNTVQRLADGGPVAPFAGGDVSTLNLVINNKPRGSVSGSRDAINAVREVLTLAARATA